MPAWAHLGRDRPRRPARRARLRAGTGGRGEHRTAGSTANGDRDSDASGLAGPGGARTHARGARESGPRHVSARPSAARAAGAPRAAPSARHRDVAPPLAL